MESFTKQINRTNGIAEFNFIRVFTPTGIRYFVRVEGTKYKPCLFTMELKNDSWKIIDAPKVPKWIFDMEAILGNAIKENVPE
jgi:hypothetical protein